MASQEFIRGLMDEIVLPGVKQLMESRYFSELREGKLSVKRLQGFSVQHYLHNVSINKGFALCMVKHAHNAELFDYFLYQLSEERTHPDLMKQFGLAIGLKEEDFQNITPVFECLAHTSAVIRNMLVCPPAETRASALVNETMVGRYAEEFDVYLRKQYGLDARACEFFSVHRVADQEHTQAAAQIIARFCNSPQEEKAVLAQARHTVSFKLAKFDGIYRAYG